MRLSNFIKRNIYYIIFTVFIIVLIFFAHISSNRRFENFENLDYGFVITRHVRSEETNLVWLTCVAQIQKFHPNKKIVIIDDNSNYEYIKNVKDIDLSNCIIIDSEFKGSGELLPYYYYSKNKWFDKMIFIHDSVFVNSEIDTTNVENVKFLWHFDGGEGSDDSLNNNIERLIQSTNTVYVDELIDLFKSNNWKGCWGVMSIITHDYVVHLFDKYNLTELVNHVKNRHDRMSLERLFGLICCFEDHGLINNSNISMYGDFRNNIVDKNANDYLQDIDDNKFDKKIVKLFFGR